MLAVTVAGAALTAAFIVYNTGVVNGATSNGGSRPCAHPMNADTAALRPPAASRGCRRPVGRLLSARAPPRGPRDHEAAEPDLQCDPRRTRHPAADETAVAGASGVGCTGIADIIGHRTWIHGVLARDASFAWRQPHTEFRAHGRLARIRRRERRWRSRSQRERGARKGSRVLSSGRLPGRTGVG